MTTPPARLGSYHLVRRVGVGGMAEVYEAETRPVDGEPRRLAVKVLLPDLQRDPELIKSFIDEATIASRLSHPNVVRVLDSGEIEGWYYLAMEYVDGCDLAEVARRAAGAGIRFPAPAAAYVVREVARALEYIHTREQPIVHRDVTPHNIFVARDGVVKLADFGIAKAPARLVRTTRGGQIKGKLGYLAPEQASGETATARTDVYAAGLILFELLAGRRHNPGTTEVDLIQHALSPASTPPSSFCPDAAPLDEVTRRALHRHPAMRTRSAVLLAEQLDRFLVGHPFDGPALARFVESLPPPPYDRSAAARPAAAVPPGPAGPEPAARDRTRRLAPEPAGSRRGRRGLWLLLAVLALGGGAALWGLQRRGSVTVAGVAEVRDATSHAAQGSDGQSTSQSHGAAIAAVSLSAPDGRISDAALANSRPGLPRDDRGRRPARPGRRLAPRARAARETGPAETHDAALAAARVPPDAGPRSVTDRERRALEQELRGLLAEAERRGAYPGDDARLDVGAARARRAIRAGGVEEARRGLGELRLAVERFQPTRASINAKLARLGRAISAARLGEEERQRVAASSQAILRLILDDDLVEASHAISRLLRRLGQDSGRFVEPSQR